VRIRDLPVEDKLRDLRQIHLNALIKIKGVVTKRTGVFPELQKIFFRC
jgi:DNA replication licensing factor MCM2